jgi:hypothetical protein
MASRQVWNWVSCVKPHPSVSRVLHETTAGSNLTPLKGLTRGGGLAIFRGPLREAGDRTLASKSPLLSVNLPSPLLVDGCFSAFDRRAVRYSAPDFRFDLCESGTFPRGKRLAVPMDFVVAKVGLGLFRNVESENLVGVSWCPIRVDIFPNLVIIAE